MRMHLLFTGLALVLCQAAHAAEPPRIDRKILKEPTYQTESPKYCLLALDRDAKSRIWLVQDGNTLYVDKNGNGDLTEKGKRITGQEAGQTNRSYFVGDFRVNGLAITQMSVTQMKVTAESVGNDEEWQRISRNGPEPWTWWVHVTAERPAADKRDLPKQLSYVINGDGNGMLLFADKPQDAPVILLGAPFTLALQDRRQHFMPGEQWMLQIGVGSQGMGPGSFAFLLYKDTIPNDAYPEAEISFPARSASDAPIRQKFTLKERC